MLKAKTCSSSGVTPKERRSVSLHSPLSLSGFGVDVISPRSAPPQALAAAKATDKVPIVFVGGGDPVPNGFG